MIKTPSWCKHLIKRIDQLLCCELALLVRLWLRARAASLSACYEESPWTSIMSIIFSQQKHWRCAHAIKPKSGKSCSGQLCTHCTHRECWILFLKKWAAILNCIPAPFGCIRLLVELSAKLSLCTLVCMHSRFGAMHEMQTICNQKKTFFFASDPLLDSTIIRCNQYGILFARFLHTAVKSPCARVPVFVCKKKKKPYKRTAVCMLGLMDMT